MSTIQETIQQARGFVDLTEGWHFGDGVPAPQERINQAIKFLEYAGLVGLERANTFPGVQGQVQITFYSGDRMLEITIESDDSFTIAEDHGRKQVYFEESRSKLDVYVRLEEFSQSIWAFSDLFTANITTQKMTDPGFQACLLISEPESHFPWSNVIAQQPRAVPFVLISSDIIASSLEAHGFTGQYKTQLSRPDVELNRRRLPAGTNVTGTFTIGPGALFAVRSRRSA